MTKPSPNAPGGSHAAGSLEQLVHIPAGAAAIEGALALPAAAAGLVLFAHGSGSSRHSPRNNYVARVLRERGLGTLLLDLLTPEEDQDVRTRFDIPLLTERLRAATRWVRAQPATQALPLGYFGASTGAAAALMAAAALGPQVQAVVSRGGRPDLAGHAQLARLQCPVLLLVGGRDEEVLALNRLAAAQMRCPHEIVVIPGATHLFEEPGTLEAVAQCAADWFVRYLTRSAR
ncbi:dienelactone hydrolase family protein [Extensimonas vulgaris]|uniref:Dienelactone hydrolase n=1 Tax=Extensimonas vulgaris TaxID=1031594 RepID=A0A369AHH1_9BURK|nr:alpha/beta family hydrolase [Extensimonas vulgaris]RCX08545.1 dienelactone hydrolase [Extensimonas vulgaris]TWI34903.1 dienelactone hydrolase [Extensimonas vulgaris]TXD14054.1 alpha/beta hydrolase [Extensimonas vulgaris]